MPSNSTSPLPDKRGLASGILTGGMGFAAVIASSSRGAISFKKQDAFFAFRTIGLVYIVVIICAIFFIKAAPSGYQPAGWKAPIPTKQGPTNKTGMKRHEKRQMTKQTESSHRGYWLKHPN